MGARDIEKDWIIKIRALSTRMSREKIAKETGIDIDYVNFVVDELKDNKDFGLDILNDNGSGYMTDDIRPGRAVIIYDPKLNSPYHHIHGEEIKVLQEYPTFFMAKALESKSIITIPKADLHTKKLEFELVS